MDLSTSNERQLRGKASDLLESLQEIFGEDKPKAEFIVVVDKYHKEKITE
jgi:hypothetical protein